MRQKWNFLVCMTLFSTPFLAQNQYLGGHIWAEQTAPAQIEAFVLTLSKEVPVDSIGVCWGDGECQGASMYASGRGLQAGVSFWALYKAAHAYKAPFAYTLSSTECCWSREFVNVKNETSTMMHLSAMYRFFVPEMGADDGPRWSGDLSWRMPVQVMDTFAVHFVDVDNDPIENNSTEPSSRTGRMTAYTNINTLGTAGSHLMYALPTHEAVARIGEEGAFLVGFSGQSFRDQQPAGLNFAFLPLFAKAKDAVVTESSFFFSQHATQGLYGWATFNEPVPESAYLKIFDMLGNEKVEIQLRTFLKTGRFDMASLPHGQYMVMVYWEGKDVFRQLFVY